MPLNSLQTGAVIANQASIKFDYNDPIVTNVWINTIDQESPTSSVQPLPAESGSSFLVSWSGNDAPLGSGIDRYDIMCRYRSAFHGVEILYGSNSSTFNGKNGHHYRFYSIATDGAGNRQITPENYQAETQVAYTQVFIPLIVR